MQSFDEIYARAAERRGGTAQLEAALAEWPAKPANELAAIPDDR